VFLYACVWRLMQRYLEHVLEDKTLHIGSVMDHFIRLELARRQEESQYLLSLILEIQDIIILTSLSAKTLKN
jgi:hypothetical protein